MKKALILVMAAVLIFMNGGFCHAESEENDMAIYHEDIASIDLESGNISRSFLNRSIGSGDSAANRFGVRVFRGKEPVDLSGCSCYGYFRNSNGDNIALTSNGTVDGNVAYVTLPQACYNYEGQFCLAIKLIGGGVTGTMRIVDGMVDNTHTGSAVAPTSTVPTYSEILSQYDAMVAATAAANGCIAETFDATQEYSAGKYVINEGALYRLTADHEENVTWANTSKVEVNFGDEISATNGCIAETFDETQEYSAGEYVIYDGGLYRFTSDHSAGTWNSAHVTEVSIGLEITDLRDDLEEDITDLRTDLNEARTDLDEIISTVLGELNYVVGYRLDRDTGELIADEDFCTSPYIPFSESSCNFYYGAYSNKIYFVEFDENKGWLEYKGAAQDSEYRYLSSLDEDCAFVRFTFNKGYTGKLMKGSNLIWIADREDGLDDDVETIKTELAAIAEDKTVQKTLLPGITSATYGYVTTGGRVEPNPSSIAYYCNKFSVNSGDVLTRTDGGLLRFVTAYNGDTAVTASGAESVTSYTVPSGITGIIITVSGISTQGEAEDAFSKVRITRDETQYAAITDDELTDPFLPANAKATGDRLSEIENRIGVLRGSYEYRGSIGANATIDMGVNFAPKIGFSAGLYGEFTGTFGGLTLQFDAYSPNQIIIDGTNVAFKSRFIGDSTKPHGITISGTFAVMVYADNPNTIAVTIYSNGEKATVSANFTITSYETFKIINGSSALSNVAFTMGCATSNHPVWLFGDSYFTMTADNRWTYYAYQNGYVKNNMFIGSTGSGSDEFNLWFDSLIEIGKPKMVVMCMGMNYGADTTEPNATWLADVQKVIAKSEQYGYEVVLATIPSVPAKNHEQKNAYVRSSGYRYIDFAKAVGAQSDGTWYTGMLAVDELHPTTTGATALYTMAICSVPELTYDYE